MASGEESSDGLKYKTVVLKVSVHCEGCKKKIEKILKKTEDVYKYEIDAAKKKVTVLGNVDADTLIMKLQKAGKNAQPWPEKTPASPNPKMNDEKVKDESKVEPPKSKEPQQTSAEKKPALAAGGDGSPAAATTAKPADSGKKKTEAAAEPPKNIETDEKEATKSDEKAAEVSTPPPEKPAAAAAAASQEKASATPETNGSASGGKKKGKKAQKKSSEEAADNKSDSSYAPAAEGVIRGVEQPVQHVQPYPMYHQLPAHFPAPQAAPPAYVMSYHMSQPTVSHAYYAPSMPEAPPPEYYAPYHPYYQLYSPAPADYYYGAAAGGGTEPASSSHQLHSYDNFFSEENPNGCSLM